MIYIKFLSLFFLPDYGRFFLHALIWIWVMYNTIELGRAILYARNRIKQQ